MLVKGTITTWNHGYIHGDLPAAGKVFVLATERINSVRASGVSGSSFYFSDNLYSDREFPNYLVCSDLTPAELVTASNLTYANNLMPFEIFTDNDPAKAIIEEWIDVKSLSHAWDYESDTDYCWLKYWEGGAKAKTVLCAFNKDALVQYADTATTTS
jgi:hypothetical protein